MGLCSSEKLARIHQAFDTIGLTGKRVEGKAGRSVALGSNIGAAFSFGAVACRRFGLGEAFRLRIELCMDFWNLRDIAKFIFKILVDWFFSV